MEVTLKTTWFWLIIVSIVMFVSTTGCYADRGRVTARDVLKQDTEADIIQYNNGNVYSNVTELEWFQDEKSKYTKKKLVGKVRKQTQNSFWFKDLYATKLPEGTNVFSTDDDVKLSFILVVEHDGEDLYYMRLLEG